MEEQGTAPERRSARQAETAARIAQERAEALARVQARGAVAVGGISAQTARRFAYVTNPDAARALREKRERQREEQANRTAARRLPGWNFTPYSGGKRRTARPDVTPAVVRTVPAARAATPRDVHTFNQVITQVGADRKWFAAGANL